MVDCPKFKDKMDRDICVMALAARRRDPSLCKGIVHPTVERICSSVLVKGECTGITDSGYRILCEASLANDPGQCGRLLHNDVSLCYTAVAIFNMDLATCDKAPDRGEKALCYSLVGSCAQLKDPQDIRLCREKVSDMIH